MTDGWPRITTALRQWPKVLNERETFARVLGGASLARFGDGEMKVAFSGENKHQDADPDLSAELREILRRPAPGLLAAIPTMDPDGLKAEFWARHRDRFLPLLDARVEYGSALVFRPDHQEHARTLSDLYATLWRKRRPLVVCSAHSKLWRIRAGCRPWGRLEVPERNAYAVIDDLERECLSASIELILISAGSAATCLANRLAQRGKWAVDVGSLGDWLPEVSKT